MHLAAAEAATFVPDTGLDYFFFFFGFHQSSSFSQEKELLGSWALQPHILASDIFFRRQNSVQKMDLSPLFIVVSRGWQLQETVGWNIRNIAAERAAKPYQYAFDPILHRPEPERGHCGLHVR